MKPYITYFNVTATSNQEKIHKRIIRIEKYGYNKAYKKLLVKLSEIFEDGCEFTINETQVLFIRKEHLPLR